MQKRLNIENTQTALEAKGLTQTALAKQLDVSKEAVSQWLKAKTFPRPGKLLQLGKMLELGFNDLVITEEPNAPVIAFRKTKGSITKEHHIERAQETGRFLQHLAEFSPFNSLEVPPVLKNPTCEYLYLQRVAQKVRTDINIDSQTTIDFTHLIRRFKDLQAVIVPVLWGAQKNHANATHIYLPETDSTWVYLNLDVNVHDFKFWMAHELGRCLSPSLTGSNEGEDFADAFAGALLFSEEKAKATYTSVSSKRTTQAKISTLLKSAEAEVISPYTIFLQINKYAEHIGEPKVDLGNGFYKHITQFNKKYKNLSDVLFDDLKDVSPRDYISKTSEAFETPFFDILSEYLKASNKGAGYVQAVTDMKLLDSRGIHAELT